jgi:hypothetical protein
MALIYVSSILATLGAPWRSIGKKRRNGISDKNNRSFNNSIDHEHGIPANQWQCA